MNLEEALKSISKDYGASAITHLNERTDMHIEGISTGAAELDLAIGPALGIPRGRITEIFGPESCIFGETLITVKREDGREYTDTISSLYENRHILLEEGFCIRGVDEVAKNIRYNFVADIVCTGIKPCWRIMMNAGDEIVCTSDHKFLTDEGYLPLGEISILSTLGLVYGNTIFYNTIRSVEYLGPRETYDIKCFAPNNNYIANNFIVHNCGKTTLALQIIAESQAKDGVAAFIDMEHALNPSYAQALGVDIDKLYISQPDTGEEALDICRKLAMTNEVDVVVVDSVAALIPRAEMEGDVGDANIGLQARLMSQAMRMLTPIGGRCAIIFINQIREKVGVMYGSNETRPGGRALKFNASLIIDVRKGEPIKRGNDVIGQRTKFKMVKNKIGGPPFKTVECDMIYGQGISKSGSIIDAAISMEIIEKSGSWLKYNGKNFAQGRDNAKEFLSLPENKIMYEEIYRKVTERE